MPSNLYHHLAFLPATEAWEIPRGLEALAQALVASGKLRINADHERNFVRYGTSDADLTFSARELTEAGLAPATRARVARLVAPALGEQGVADVWAHLKNELKKARGLAFDKELKVARVLVQSAHPAVIQLLIASGTEVFVSYSHNVSDLVALEHWQDHGQNSGMQAVENPRATKVYVSAGGDPFFEGEAKTYVTDGFPALARMVVIAGQELGHFADLRRDGNGAVIGRYSTDAHHSQLRADSVAAAGRLKDIENCKVLSATYAKAGLSLLRRAETGLAFYHKRLRYSPPWFFYQLFRFGAWMRFVHSCKKRNLQHSFSSLPYLRLGEAVSQYLEDMAFNLAPDAEVYRNPDPLVEEAIAVIEAVARVPQQVNKWKHRTVMQAWPNLYPFYYGVVITSVEKTVKNHLPEQIAPLSQRLKISFRRRIRTKPGYYP